MEEERRKRKEKCCATMWYAKTKRYIFQQYSLLFFHFAMNPVKNKAYLQRSIRAHTTIKVNKNGFRFLRWTHTHTRDYTRWSKITRGENIFIRIEVTSLRIFFSFVSFSIFSFFFLGGNLRFVYICFISSSSSFLAAFFFNFKFETNNRVW